MTDMEHVSEESEFETLVGLLDDAYARDVLRETSEEPMTVPEIAERSAASESTLYRRVEALQRADLLSEQTRPRKDGHHESVYSATLQRLSVTLSDGRFEVELDRTDVDAVDRLQRLWSDF